MQGDEQPANSWARLAQIALNGQALAAGVSFPWAPSKTFPRHDRTLGGRNATNCRVAQKAQPGRFWGKRARFRDRVDLH
jgi:hypothetical protein